MNRILYSDDCLNVLNDELALPANSVDLIYLDPPFNSNSDYNLPFRGKDKDTRPVAAFKDTWTWGIKEDELLADLASGPLSRNLANIIRLAQQLGQGHIGGVGGQQQYSLPAYLLNMATRLLPMRRILKKTGSIYLHCDPTASHYLKLVMDSIFGSQNYLNEVIWAYRKWTNAARLFQRNHDVIFAYAVSKGDHIFNKLYNPDAPQKAKYERGWDVNVVGNGIRQLIVYDPDKAAAQINAGNYDRVVHREHRTAVALPDFWEIPIINSQAKERLGYPTQKPLALLERVIAASCPPNGLVLDPFCGCGTAIHAAEKLGRRWIGVDLSAFAVGLMRERILRNFENLTTDDVIVRGVPVNLAEAEALARRDKFEFEKWVCGAIGAEGMFHQPGTKGSDGGVDGVLKFFPFRMGRKPKPEYAIVQVKGGNVTADSVKALKTTVDRFEATAGVMVCFNRYMRTVENQRERTTFSDDGGTYPVIQGLSIEDLLADKRPDLPLYGYRRQGGRINAQSALLET